MKKKDVESVLEKIVVNAGVGKLSQQTSADEKALSQIMQDLARITGQRPQVRKARKSIAGFKIREGATVGLKITLRGKKMVDFFERLITIVLPRVHDFRGISLDSIDEGGNLSIGFREQFVFPEISPEESTLTFSLGVNMVPKEHEKEHAIETYRKLGVPLKKEEA